MPAAGTELGKPEAAFKPLEFRSDMGSTLCRAEAVSRLHERAWRPRALLGPLIKEAPAEGSDSDDGMKCRWDPKASAVARPVNKAPARRAVITTTRSGGPFVRVPLSMLPCSRYTTDVIERAPLIGGDPVEIYGGRKMHSQQGGSMKKLWYRMFGQVRSTEIPQPHLRSFLIVLQLCFVVLAVILLSNAFNNGQIRILYPFGLFIVSIIFFAVLYFAFYLKDRRSFRFSADITTDRHAVMTKAIDDEVNRIRENIPVLQYVCESDPAELNVEYFTPNSGVRQIWTTLSIVGTTTLTAVSLYRNLRAELEIITASGARLVTPLDRMPRSPPDDRDGLLRCHRDCLMSLRARYEVLSDRRSSLGTNKPDVWDFADFLYFSVVTQSTVGYGDIVPNTRRARLLVALQLLVGVFITGFFFNLLFGPG
jgi:hypothetical protein